MTHEDCVIRLTTWHWTTCLGGFIWKTWLDLSDCVRPPAVGAWLTSSVTPPVVFCHLCSLTTESKCGGQVFSQHMILKNYHGSGRKRPQKFEIETFFFFFFFFSSFDEVGRLGVKPQWISDVKISLRTSGHCVEEQGFINLSLSKTQTKDYLRSEMCSF